MLGHKISLNKFKKIEIIPKNFLSPSSMKLKIKQEENCETHKHMKIQQHSWMINGSKKKIKRVKSTLRQTKMETQYTKIYGI